EDASRFFENSTLLSQDFHLPFHMAVLLFQRSVMAAAGKRIRAMVGEFVAPMRPRAVRRPQVAGNLRLRLLARLDHPHCFQLELSGGRLLFFGHTLFSLVTLSPFTFLPPQRWAIVRADLRASERSEERRTSEARHVLRMMNLFQ